VGEDVHERDLILPPTAEVGYELAERRHERERPVTDQRQQQRSGRELRERREVEDGVRVARRIGWRARIGAARAGRVRLDAALLLDANDARGEQGAGCRVDDRFDPLEAQSFFIPSPIR
jgi:hypothetical protein